MQCKCKCKYNISIVSSVSVCVCVNKIAFYLKKKKKKKAQSQFATNFLSYETRPGFLRTKEDGCDIPFLCESLGIIRVLSTHLYLKWSYSIYPVNISSFWLNLHLKQSTLNNFSKGSFHLTIFGGNNLTHSMQC